MNNNHDFLRIPNWYPYLAAYAFPTSFVRLRPEAVAFLGASDEERKSVCRDRS